MYKFNRNSQITFGDFNQPLGMKMNENNRWVKKAKMIPWDKIEEKYAKLSEHRNILQKRIIIAFPHIKSHNHTEQLEHLKEKLHLLKK